MRTTISIDEHLLRRARSAAAASGRTLSDLVEDALRASLARREAPRARVVLPTFRGDGLMPGVDLDDTASLLELMDESAHDASV